MCAKYTIYNMVFGCAILVRIKHGSFVRYEFKVHVIHDYVCSICVRVSSFMYYIASNFWVNGDL